MKKNVLYIGIAVVVGLLAGWIIFGNNGTESKSGSAISDTHDHSNEIQEVWTCSMHPQIMQPEPGNCPICGMNLIPVETGGEGLAMNEIKMTKNAMSLANIQTSIVGSNMSSEKDGIISLSGKIATNEENNSVQASYFDGRIEQLNVNYKGQKVNNRQLLATIYSPNLVAAQQELITAASLKESQPALYQAVRNKLKNWKLSDTQIDAIESSGKVRDNFPVYATINGTVSEVMAREGDYVKQGQPILKVSNLNSVWADFDAYENQISNLKEGQKIKVEANAYSNKEFDATITFIDPMLNNATRTVTVRATIKNNDNLFKPGMFVTGKVQGTKTQSEMLSVPASAVMWTGERSLVYVKTNPNEPVFEMREVSIHNRNGENYTISSGVQTGEEIVTNGIFTVDAAAQLQGKKSMMNKAKEDATEMPKSQMRLKFSERFTNNFNNVIKPYLKMKDAFVATDAKQISAFAKMTSKAMKSADTKDLGKMEQSHINKTIDMLDAIGKSDNIKNQRADFIILNENLVAIAMNIKGANPLLYVQKCPMANNNKGAIWLSTEKDIKNPYYGDDMLTCGSVIEEINE
ncbi:efflux RND transporter periplasmic adaptor subunit [Maribacter arcticus]|uniref:Membrane fusion protein, Cu(I)/Ag(I) efflux system n=2 Tax=Maribacter arcticus TaxID=561365 RepID=A0A1T5BBA7_9FLAO|nr:efflux RND transporter periplasmic adaptor subunit [Maribacter arcticus]SKB44536.1 membrane fusion protein, Cu(I)/Ag(I) efflux system [Maribacter arcticus]